MNEWINLFRAMCHVFLNDLNYLPKAVNEWMNLFHGKHIAIKIRFPNKFVMFTFDISLLLLLTSWKICLNNNSKRSPKRIQIYTRVGF